MTLEGAKLICLDEAGNHGEVLLAKGRKFTVGYYMNCDLILVDERAKGVHCEIECDAFGRVTVRNFSPDKPILVNGSSVQIKRVLLNNSKLSILDKEYLWLFASSSNNEFEELSVYDASTPHKLISIPEQPPRSCPDFKICRDLPRRFTVHNFAYCIQSNEEGNTPTESNAENDNKNVEPNKSLSDKNYEHQASQSDEQNFDKEEDFDKEKENLYRCITPDPNEQLIKSTTEQLETPKMNLINCTKDKENRSTEKKNKQLLKMCHQSDVVLTSFSPREAGIKVCKSFAVVVKPKVLLTVPPTTPRSVYSTPENDMNAKRIDTSDLMAFYTPSTSKKISECATGLPASSIKVLKNSSMHLIDLTTPTKLRPASPYLLKSDLKNVALKVEEKSSANLPSVEQLGLATLPNTPVVINASNVPLETASSVISVNSSVENSSVIEVTSDVSDTNLTPTIPDSLNTPLKATTRIGVCTPKRTPQSLMKRAILTSAKKQNTTPRREPINRIPLRSHLALARTPVTPPILHSSSSSLQSPKRQSMSTPIRINASHKRFDPSVSAIVSDSSSTSAKTCARRSSLNSISAAKALRTSTPVSGRSVLIKRVACKTSPLHKVRKSVGGVPLSSHIAKARKSIQLLASSSKISSIKEKSPQQLMSGRLVKRARKSVSSRVNILQQAAKTPTQSTDCKTVLFAKQHTDNEEDTLNRTFTLDASEGENVAGKKDATFSPDKKSTDKKSVRNNKEEQHAAIEIPVDAEEVIDLCNENKENTKQKVEEDEQNNVMGELCTEVAIKEDNLEDETDHANVANRVKTIVTEESFAEEVAASIKQNNRPNSGSSLLLKSDSVDIKSADATEQVVLEASTKNGNGSKGVAETGFGEESSASVLQTSPRRTTTNKESPTAGDAVAEEHFVKALLPKPDNDAQSLVGRAQDAGKATSDAQNPNEYKPIVEDITLEGSLIEKETQGNEEKNINKRLCKDINLKDSLVEEKVKSEEAKEENTKTAIEEPKDKEQVSAGSKDNEEMPAHSQTVKQINTTVANINLTAEKNCTSSQEKEEALAVKSENAEKSSSNPIDMEEFSYTNYCAKNIEVKNETTKATHQQNVIQPINTQDDGSELKELQVFQAEQSQVVEATTKSASPISYERKIEENLEDTNKLLEEIEDVLNKSDEIQQKHLNDLEQSGGNKSLTEEFESEQFSQESVAETNELKVVENLAQNSQKHTEHVAEFAISDSHNENPKELQQKQIPADLDADNISTSSAIEKCHLNLPESQTSTATAIDIDLDTSKLQNETADDTTSKQTEGDDGITAADNVVPEFKNNQSKTDEKSPHITTEEEEDVVTEMNSNSKQIKVINKIVENVAAFTPRRSARRASQSSDVSEITAAITFTPRRSTRRSSMSAESTTATAVTPTTTTRTARRASLSMVNDTPSTPKPISKRRLSISVDEDTAVTPSTSKLHERVKTPRKQLERSLVIPEKIDKICTAIMEDEEEAEPRRSQVEEKKNAPHESEKEIETTIEQSAEKREAEKPETLLDAIEEAAEENLDRVVAQEDCEDNLHKLQQDVLADSEESCVHDMPVEQKHSEGMPVATKNEKIIIEEKSGNSQQSAAKPPTIASHQPPDDSVRSPVSRAEEHEDLRQTGNLENITESFGKEASPDKDTNILHESPKTARFAGVQNSILTPKSNTENETDEIEDEELAELSAEMTTPKSRKHVAVVAESPKTPVMTGLSELLKTTKAELKTPKFAGIRDLIRTPKTGSENEQEQTEKLAMVAELLKTPECAKIAEEMPSSSLKGVKELLKTPKHLSTPHLKGIRELLKTPKGRDTPNTTGVKELLETPQPQPSADIQVANLNIEDTTSEDLPSSTCESTTNVERIQELLKTPKSCSTPRRPDLRESKAPKISSTSSLSNIKELSDDTTVQESDRELEKYLRTPTAKNIMIPSMPSSALIEKSGDSIEISTEYDLNDTNEAHTTNLEELFRTPVTAHFAERIADTYYEEEKAAEDGLLQCERIKTAEESFDKLIGQESQIQTPIRKQYARKPFTLKTPTCSSPFTSADILSDLPKTDVEEWIENLDQAEPPTSTKCNEDEEESEELEINNEVDRSAMNIGEISIIENETQNRTLNESIIPETCAKLFIAERSLHDKSPTSLNYGDTKDPLLNSYRTELHEKVPSSVTSADAEMSGINLLDQTMASIQDDQPSMLDEPLFVEEPSVFDEPLLVSDNESEAENTSNVRNNPESSHDEGNDLSEPLVLSDSEGDTSNRTIKSALEVTESKTDTEVQEKSMLEKLSSNLDLLAEDPLETVGGDMPGKDLKEIQNETDNCSRTKDEIMTLPQDEAAETEDQTSFCIEADLQKETIEDHRSAIVITDDVLEESAEKPISKSTELPEISSTYQLAETGNDSTVDDMDAEVDAAETVANQLQYEHPKLSTIVDVECKEVAIEQTKISSTESEDVFVDTSVTEICEETNILDDKERTEMKETTQETSKMKAGREECRDIFLDNSNIDESFADEAVNEENRARSSAAITDTTTAEQNVLYTATIEKETVAACTEPALSEETSKQIESVPSNSENTELVTKTNTTSELEIIVLDDSSVESTANAEINSLAIEMSESQSKENEHREQKDYQTESNIQTPEPESTTILNETELHVDIPDEIVDETGEKLEESSKICDLSESSVGRHAVKKEVVCETEKKTNASVIEMKPNEFFTNELISTRIEDVTEESVDSKDDKNMKLEDNKSSETKKSLEESVEEQTIETNITPKSEEVYPSNEIEISDNVTSEDTLSTVSNTEQNVSEKITQTSENTEEETEIQTETVLEESAGKDHDNKPSEEHQESVAEENDVTEEENIETTIEFSMQEVLPVARQTTSISEESTILVNPTEIVKYDFEIKINERNRSEKSQEEEEDTLYDSPETSSQIECSQTSGVEPHEKTENVGICPAESPLIAKPDEILNQEGGDTDEKQQRKNSVTENSQETAEDDEMQTSSRRNPRKVAKNPMAETPKEIIQDITESPTDIISSDEVTEDSTTRRKRTTSESSHGSVTRKGGRRKIHKTQEPIVEDEHNGAEIKILKQLEDKNSKEDNPTEPARIESRENSIEENEKYQSIDFITTQPETISEEKQSAAKSGIIIPESNSHRGVKKMLPATQAQIAVTDQLAEELSVEEQSSTSLCAPPKQTEDDIRTEEPELVENVVENVTTPCEIHKIEKPVSPTLLDTESIGDKNTLKPKFSSEIEISERTLNVSAVLIREEEITEAVTEEIEHLPAEIVSHKPAVFESNPDFVHQAENKPDAAGPTLPEKDSQKDEVTSAKIINKTENIPKLSETVGVESNTDDATHNRMLSESSQDLQLDDDNTRSKRNLRKIQKASLEKIVPEEHKEIANEQSDAKTEQNTEEVESSVPEFEQNVMINLVLGKTDAVPSEASTSQHCPEQINEVSTASLEVVEPIQKRSRRKVTVSESSVENAPSRARRGGRKAPKAGGIEEIQREAEYQYSPLDSNKTEEDSLVRDTKNADVVAEVFKLEINQDKAAASPETSRNIPATEDANKHEESQATTSRHNKNKPVLQDTPLKEQTTTRRGRRKVAVSDTDVVIVEPDSELKSPTQIGADQDKHVLNAGNVMVENKFEEASAEVVATNTDSSSSKTGRRGKQHKMNAKNASKEKTANEDNLSSMNSEPLIEQSEKETLPKQTNRRARQRKADATKEDNTTNTPKPVSPPHTRRGGRHNKETAEIAASSSLSKARSTNRNRKTPVEHITGDSQTEFTNSKSGSEMLDEHPTTASLPQVAEEIKETANKIVFEVSLNENEKSIREAAVLASEIKSIKKPTKRTHSPPHPNIGIDESPVKQLKHEAPVVEASGEMAVESHLANVLVPQKTEDKNVSNQDEKPKEVETEAAVKRQKSTRRKAAAKHEEPATKTRRNTITEDVMEPKNENDKPQIVEVNPEAEAELDKPISSQAETQDDVKAKRSRTKATLDENRSEEQEEAALSTRKRAVARKMGRTKLVVEGLQTTPEHAAPEEESKPEEQPTEGEIRKQNYDTEEESSQIKSSGETSSRRRNYGRQKVESKNKQPSEDDKQEDGEPTDVEEKHESAENQQPQEETKRGRGRKKKLDQVEDSKAPAAAKPRGRKRKEIINTDVNDPIWEDKEQHPSENTEQQRPDTPVRSASTAKKGLIEHITAETKETEDTPHRRARNVPQRKAATAYHNYDETSDSETTSKAKKKTDTPRKSLEATKKSPVAAVAATAPPPSSVSPSPSSTTSITTARGRTRKPTAKVQQYLEEERAKAATPKKRALLTAAATYLDTGTPQRTPAKRARKASAIEMDVEGTPQTTKGRGRGRNAAVLHAEKHEEEPIALPAVATTSADEKNVELPAAATTQSSTKTRIGGRKEKLTEEENVSSSDEPTAKKPPLQLENEKQEPSHPSDHPTPTRIAGRRNAAAAAKARIEEDALAAAAIEPPRRVRAKKVTQKVSAQTVANTDTDQHRTVEAAGDLKQNTNTSEKEEVKKEDVQGEEDTNIRDKTLNKRARKPAAIAATDSPAVPTKRGRKAKIAEAPADPKTPVESKPPKGRGRGRKNVHFDELETVDVTSSQPANEAEVEAASADVSEPVKRGTRTRRK